MIFQSYSQFTSKGSARTEGGREAPARGGGLGAGRDASATTKEFHHDR